MDFLNLNPISLFQPTEHTEINNNNINSLVHNYIYRKNKLPYDLQGKAIGKWDVRKVTSMFKLFAYTDFNEDINDWDVSNVTNMDVMFLGCKKFNQPLHP